MQLNVPGAMTSHNEASSVAMAPARRRWKHQTCHHPPWGSRDLVEFTLSIFWTCSTRRLQHLLLQRRGGGIIGLPAEVILERRHDGQYYVLAKGAGGDLRRPVNRRCPFRRRAPPDRN